MKLDPLSIATWFALLLTSGVGISHFSDNLLLTIPLCLLMGVLAARLDVVVRSHVKRIEDWHKHLKDEQARKQDSFEA